ncbi:MAG: alcohol dehydrogenase catalytic domain-containing protein, partial [Nocardioides sp.]
MSARAIRVERHGEPDTLVLTHMDVPVPSPGQVLIEVETAGVAYADVLMRRGVYPESPALAFTPGYDVVGRVLALGGGVDHVGVGARVAALTVTGGYSTHALAPACFTVPVAEHLRAAQVSALVLNYVTAKQMLERIAYATPGGSILVHGAAGGVGTALLELARHNEILAIGSASGSRTAAVTARGAVALDRNEVDVIAETLRLVPDGVAATFDAIGGPH